MKSVIVLLGPPGSGKGTQGEMLSEKLGYVRLSTGDMLREAVRNGTELGKKAKTYMDSGALVPNDLIIGLMKEKIAQAEGGVILDGFPRTVEQADALDQQLQVDLALNLDVPDEELSERIRERTRQMVSGGLIAETEKLLARGIKNNPSAASAIGYRETIAWLENCSRNERELEEQIARDTEALVKKQRKYFKNSLLKNAQYRFF